ncbi:MAG: glycosyltransferase family 39 protein, partial [bacterium]
MDESTDTTGEPRAFDKRDLLLICAVVVLAVVVRVVFFRGLVSNDEFNYLRHAAEVWKGRFEPGDIGFFHGTRPVIFVPVAWAFALFGVSELSALIWPFAASIVTVILTFWIGRRLFDREHAVYAALLAAFVPLLVDESTRLLPGAIMNLVITASVTCFLVSENTGRLRTLWLLVSGVLLGAMLLTVEIGLIFGIVFPLFVLLKRRAPRGLIRDVLGYWPLAVGFTAVVVANTVYYWVETGNPLFRSEVSRMVLATTASEIRPVYYLKAMLNPLGADGGVFYLAGAGALAALLGRRREALVVLGWFIVSWLFLEYATTSLTEYRPLYKSVRYLSVAAVPGVLLAAVGLVWIRGLVMRTTRGGAAPAVVAGDRGDAAPGGVAGGGTPRAGGASAAAVVLAALIVVFLLSVVTLQKAGPGIDIRRAGLHDVEGYVRGADAETIYTAHWFWNTAVGFFMDFEPEYFPSGYDPYHAVDVKTVDPDTKNRYVQTLSPGDEMGAGILIHDRFLFEASLGRELSYGVGKGEIPIQMGQLAEHFELVDSIAMTANRVVEIYSVTAGER